LIGIGIIILLYVLFPERKKREDLFILLRY
jgi:hypothetical protein